MTAISNRHTLVEDQALSAHRMVQKWVSGLKLMKGVTRSLLPLWSLDLVLAAVKKPPFESISSASLKYLTWKPVFLLPIMLTHRTKELHALCYKEPYLAISEVGMVLYPNIDFLLIVNTLFQVTQHIVVPAMYGEVEACLVCVRWALKFCLIPMESLRADDIQLFLPMVGSQRGSPSSSSGFPAGWWR